MSRTAAWAYWLANHDAVESAVRRFATSHRLDSDDLRQSLLVSLVETHERFDPARGSASTWAHWQARAIVTKATRRVHRRLHEQEFDDTAPHASSDTQTRRMEAHVEAQRILDLATQTERDACAQRVERWSESEIRERLGCAPFSVRRRVSRLAARLNSNPMEA